MEVITMNKNYLCALLGAAYLAVAFPAAAEDKNPPTRPPIQKPVTIYDGEEIDDLPDVADIADPLAYKAFPESYPNGSRVLRLPVQVWPEPTVTSTQSTVVLQDKSGYNAQGWSVPNVSGYADLGWMEAEFCPGKTLRVHSYEKDGNIVNFYRAGETLLAFSKNDTVFVSKGGSGKFTHSANEMDLCDLL